MEFIYYYFIFALSVGLWTCVEVLPRARKRLFEKNKLDSAVYDSPIIAFLVLLVLATIAAPLLVLGIFDDRIIESVVDGIVDSQQ